MTQKAKTRADAGTIDTGRKDMLGAAARPVRVDDITLLGDLQGRLALRPKEAAALLGIGTNAIYTLCHREDFPSIRVGQSFILPVDGLRRWLLEKGGAADADC